MIRTILPLFLCFIVGKTGFSQYWQQEVNYKIEVSLNDNDHSLTGFEKIEYLNNSPDTLNFIWFHIWPNAYKNDKTAFSDQLLANNNTRFYFADNNERGYINRMDFKVDNVTAQTEDHPQHIDIIKLNLPEPLLPGKSIVITTPFHVKLPFNFSRGGHVGQSYQITQWYPKPAVYDRNGWHAIPYLDQGEFYSEFGSYHVRITVPENYVVAATGTLEDKDEIAWLKTRKDFQWTPVAEKLKSGTGQSTITYQLFPESSKKLKTLNFYQDNIHDFAWFADKRYIVNMDTCKLSSGKIIDVITYYTPGNQAVWKKSVHFSKDALRFYSSQIGDYPYPVIQAVEGPESFGGGMEYPTITVISPVRDTATLDDILTHEIGHNWFYGILASNERKYPWMDEGMNSFYDNKYRTQKYGPGAKWEQILFETSVINKKDQPINIASSAFTEKNYALGVYYKSSEWLKHLELQIGEANFSKGMQEYFRRWKFKHPQPEDFKMIMEEAAGTNLDSVFSLLSKTGLLPHLQRKGKDFAILPFIKPITRYLKNPVRDLITAGPLAGFNDYDKLLAGAFITNIKLPPSKFQFFIAPLYGISSNKPGGTGLVNYSFFSNGKIRAIDLGINASAFTVDEFSDNSGNQSYLGFQKFVPSLRLTFKNKNPLNQTHNFVQFKTFMINEDALKFFRDTVVNGNDTSILNRFRTISNSRTLNQLILVFENPRALYPYKTELKVEQGEKFIRTAFTGQYFFNYPKEGGLQVRFFAGKFFYTSSKTLSAHFETDRYHLNMSGPNGYEDYTYSNYFLGRNRFEGLASQQMLIRDGAFKVRTELLADKVGRSDNWLMSANFNSSIPTQINPLSVLPVKIPARIFLDIGTHADAWKNGATEDRFLFDAGIQLAFFKDVVNIFIPIIYSPVFRDYFESTIPKKERFWKKLTFSINLPDFHFRKPFNAIDL